MSKWRKFGYGLDSGRMERDDGAGPPDSPHPETEKGTHGAKKIIVRRSRAAPAVVK